MTACLRVAAMQLRAHDRRDFPRVCELIADDVQRVASHADLIVLPEATFPAYVIGNAAIDMRAVETALERLRRIASATRTVIVVGAAAANGAVRNAAFVIDADGSLAGRTDKLFLWHFDRRWFSPGERIEPIATAVGVLGVLICADGRLPTIARHLVDRGAAALVMPTAWVTSGRDPHRLENAQADLLGRVRAYENRVPFVAANKCGSELGMVAYCGKSQIVNPQGEIVAIAGEREPETLFGSIVLGSEAPQRSTVPPPQMTGAHFDGPLRLAISIDPLPEDIDARIEVLDDGYALSPCDPESLTALCRKLPAAAVEDSVVLDPAGLVAYRRANYALICWSTALGDPWSERIARARAMELRLYIVVFDRSMHRAFAVDPDGTIVAGTFDGYRLASFALDPRKTTETTVAPGSDVGVGLARIAEIIDAPA
ncbi:MAG: carbon-nitrogen hydrolase family protein [Candidatus Eremiobacteraeota bacterium]|nr:carbon-nitrogen hydrolase family protein [Candidatus Eremiobacteraeota bacterium]